MVVDCRAIYSVAPAGALRRTGVELQETQVFGPAKGESVRRRMGEVPLRDRRSRPGRSRHLRPAR